MSRCDVCLGCGLANRIRRIPGTPLHRFEQTGEIARRVVGRLIVVDDLAEELHLGPAGRTASSTSARMSRLGRIRSCPLVYGTTQKAQ